MTHVLLDPYGRPYHAVARPTRPVSLASAPAPAINVPAPAKRVTLATTDVITVYMTACPNKPDTQAYMLFHCYQDGQTVADFIEAAKGYGITATKARAHLAWDLKRDRIALNA
jgi:hypothetical protein